MPFFHQNGYKIFYVDLDEREDTSKGLPLVFVHGAGSSHIIWTLQLLSFKKTNRVIALDLPGHGRSEESPDEVSIKHCFSHEVAALVNHLGLEDFILVGHSMGGGIVMAYTLEESFKQPCAITLVDTSSDLDLKRLALGLVRETLDDLTLDFDFESMGDDLDGFPMKQFQDVIKKVDAKTLLRDLAACDDFDITDQLGSIKMPAFVIVGEDDDITTPEMARKLEAALPRADVAVVKEAHHRPMVEEPATFNKMFRSFINWVEEKEV